MSIRLIEHRSHFGAAAQRQGGGQLLIVAGNIYFYRANHYEAYALPHLQVVHLDDPDYLQTLPNEDLSQLIYRRILL